MEKRSSLTWITGDFVTADEDIDLRRALVREALGRLTEVTVEFLWKTDEEPLSTFLGKRMTLHVAGQTESGPDRLFTGTIVSVETLGLRRGKGHYVAELRPKLWMLTRRRNSRVFQDMSTPQIIQTLLEEHGLTQKDVRLNAQYRKRPTCVQYQETDFDFISRLMEQEGIYYYFDHSEAEGKDEQVVFCDGSGSHGPVPVEADLPYMKRDASASLRGDHIAEWASLQTVQSTRVTLSDLDYRLSGTIVERSEIEMGERRLVPKGEIFVYPGRFTTLGRDHGEGAPDSASGKDRARVWMESLAASHDVRRGAGTVRHLGTGYRFFVHAEEVGADELERDEFLVVDAVHYLQEAAGYEEVPIRRDLVSERVRLPEDNRDVYSSTFTAIKAATPFRSPPVTPWPRIVGPQTATVVGQGDIHSDALGRIRVRFHWSRKPNGDPLPAQPDIDDHASCWVRVVTPWAGQDYGFVALPRVGMEAVIAFEDGDPDRPICTGMVYDGTRKQPYDYGTSENWTQIGLRSNSSPDGGGFNELMFDDKAGSERVYLQAQKDFEELVKNDATVQIDNNLTHTVKQDETREVTSGNLSVDVKAGTATLKAAQKIELVCGQSKITMTPQKIEVTSMNVEISGSMSAKLQSNAATDVLSTGIVKVNGSLVKIN